MTLYIGQEPCCPWQPEMVQSSGGAAVGVQVIWHPVHPCDRAMASRSWHAEQLGKGYPGCVFWLKELQKE